MATQPFQAIEVFYSYSHRDEDFKNDLIKHLANLERQGIITGWHDRKIIAGQEWAGEIDEHLDRAQVILLLISPDFMFSNYCNDIEVRRAMERHEAGEARVIPVILRSVDWEGAPFSKLQALPTDAKPITLWKDRDEAFLTIVKEIRRALKELSTSHANTSPLHIIPRPPIVGFVARRDRDGNNIVERLRGELAPHKNQIIALWGGGGIGKTTLASEAARAMAEDFAQRVVWVSADQRSNLPFTTFLDEIAAQLGDEDLRRLALEQKIEAVRALIVVAPTLIVLDNFETITPEDQLQCMEFLAQRARCTALITTRQKIERAIAIPIAAMSAEEANDFLQRLINQTQDPDIYAELDRNRLIETAEANPLIIEWIVGQIDLANDPEQVLTELSQGEGDAAHRVFDRSFNLRQMADGGRAVLLALSLFTPSATRAALAEVAGMGKEKDKKRFKKAQETLASLWLIKKTEAGQRLSVAGLTRELTKARLLTDPRKKTYKQRFVARFQHYANIHDKTTSEDLNTLEAEKANLLSAIDVAFIINDHKSVLNITNAIAEFLDIRGYWDEFIQLGEQALKLACIAESGWHIGAFANSLGGVYAARGDHLSAKKHYEIALKIAREFNIKQGLSATLNQLGMLAQDEGELAEAQRFYDESLEISKRLNDQIGIANALRELATLAQDRGDLAEAERLSDESFEISTATGNQYIIASCMHQLGRVAQAHGELAKARQLYNESLEIKKNLGDKNNIASILHNLATLAQDRGDLVEARQLCDESLEISKSIGNQNRIASTLYELGRLAKNNGNNIEAANLYSEALSIFERLKSPHAVLVRQALARLEEEFS